MAGPERREPLGAFFYPNPCAESEPRAAYRLSDPTRRNRTRPANCPRADLSDGPERKAGGGPLGLGRPPRPSLRCRSSILRCHFGADNGHSSSKFRGRRSLGSLPSARSAIICFPRSTTAPTPASTTNDIASAMTASADGTDIEAGGRGMPRPFAQLPSTSLRPSARSSQTANATLDLTPNLRRSG